MTASDTNYSGRHGQPGASVARLASLLGLRVLSLGERESRSGPRNAVVTPTAQGSAQLSFLVDKLSNNGGF